MAECNQPTTSSPLSDLVVFFHRQPRSYCTKQPRSDLVLADCQVLANGSSLEASQCARIVRTAFGQRFQANPDQMQIGSSMFTGL